MTDDLERHLLSSLGQLDRLIWGVRDEPEFGQTPHHLADRGRTDVEPVGQVLRRNGAFIAAGLVDGLYIVFDGRGEHLMRLLIA